ncbi:MAG: hypothetical protein LJE69_00160 [Thiohalocapsa sp.]|jgi:hypothetical protein|uniref:hypothetical protein n=1 Tax=Thiohalocapsa sp. TaxID=2497641 RepID=UPI0025CD8EA7|nr:hypothetical protein [Thiohalocapsa sp.]MCG6939650.1 hypothetical protein [Thiohalocapsa sp.]
MDLTNAVILLVIGATTEYLAAISLGGGGLDALAPSPRQSSVLVSHFPQSP